VREVYFGRSLCAMCDAVCLFNDVCLFRDALCLEGFSLFKQANKLFFADQDI